MVKKEIYKNQRGIMLLFCDLKNLLLRLVTRKVVTEVGQKIGIEAIL